MEELISILTDIRDQLADLNNKIDTLTGHGKYSILDICGKLEDLDSSLEDINSALGTIDATLTMMD